MKPNLRGGIKVRMMPWYFMWFSILILYSAFKVCRATYLLSGSSSHHPKAKSRKDGGQPSSVYSKFGHYQKLLCGVSPNTLATKNHPDQCRRIFERVARTLSQELDYLPVRNPRKEAIFHIAFRRR